MKARIHKTQQNSKYQLCDKRDEMINRIISEYRKLAQKDWVGKVIYWEPWKKRKFDHSNKWYMHNPEFIPENETYKIHWDFEIQTDHLISTRWPDLLIVKKKKKKKKKKINLLNCDLHRSCSIKKVKREISTWTLLGNWEKLWNKKVTVISIVFGALGTVTKRLVKGLEELGIRTREGTIQITALLRSIRILRRVMESCYHSNLSERPSADTDGKNS